MLKGGVIMDVTTPEQAKIAEDAGACCGDGARARAGRHPQGRRRGAHGAIAVIEAIQRTVSIPVMAKVRIGHFVEARVLEALGVDFIDESEVLTPADEEHHIDKHGFRSPFVCGARNLGEALRRIGEGAAMIRTKGEAGSGNIVEAVRHLRQVNGDIRAIQALRGRRARRRAPRSSARRIELVRARRRARQAAGAELRRGRHRDAGRRRALHERSAPRPCSSARASSRATTPRRARGPIVHATTHWQEPGEVLAASRGLGAAMAGIEISTIPENERLANRGW